MYNLKAVRKSAVMGWSGRLLSFRQVFSRTSVWL